MTDQELDEILAFRWPILVRRVLADCPDEWLRGFVRSIVRHGRRWNWRPTARQEALMTRLLAEHRLGYDDPGSLIEDDGAA